MNNHSAHRQKPLQIFGKASQMIVQFIQIRGVEFVNYLHRCRTLKTYKKTLDFEKILCYNIFVKGNAFLRFLPREATRSDVVRQMAWQFSAGLIVPRSLSEAQRLIPRWEPFPSSPFLFYGVRKSVRQGWWIFIKRRGGSPPLRRNHRRSAVLPPQGTAGTRK